MKKVIVIFLCIAVISTFAYAKTYKTKGEHLGAWTKEDFDLFAKTSDDKDIGVKLFKEGKLFEIPADQEVSLKRRTSNGVKLRFKETKKTFWTFREEIE